MENLLHSVWSCLLSREKNAGIACPSELTREFTCTLNFVGWCLSSWAVSIFFTG